MRFSRHYQMTKGEISIAPLVDVVLQQLIYFMLTSSFIMQPGIKIKLPTAVTSERVEQKEVIVSVAENGSIFYEEKPVSIEQLEIFLAQTTRKNPHVLLVIKGDCQARHRDIVRVMDRARRAGIDRLAIATTPEMEQ